MVGLPPDLPAGWRSSEIGAILGSLPGRTQAHTGSIIAFWAAWDVCDTPRHRQLPPRGARRSGMAQGTSLAALSARSILLQKKIPLPVHQKRTLLYIDLYFFNRHNIKESISFFDKVAQRRDGDSWSAHGSSPARESYLKCYRQCI